MHPDTSVLHELCRYTDADGSSFWGGWQNGQRHGLGVQISSSGTTTFGEWDGGESLGRSVELESQGWLLQGENSLNGNTLENKVETKRGQGICTFENGDAYVGQWIAEKRPDSESSGGTSDGNTNLPHRKPDSNAGVCVWERTPGSAWTGGATVSFFGGGFYKYVVQY